MNSNRETLVTASLVGASAQNPRGKAPGSGGLLWRMRGGKGVVGLLFLLLCLGGCGGGFPILQRMKPLPADPACRIAVLPLVNESDYPLADVIMHKVFAGLLSEMGNFSLAQEGDIHKIYQQFRIYPGQVLSADQMKILASRLNVQMLITGSIIKMHENPGPNNSVNPELAFRLQILDAGTAETLWSTYHRRQGVDYQKTMHFGQINSMIRLCQEASREIINLWFEQGLTRCDISSQF
jgi:hypothetical protein